MYELYVMVYLQDNVVKLLVHCSFSFDSKTTLSSFFPFLQAPSFQAISIKSSTQCTLSHKFESFKCTGRKLLDTCAYKTT